MRCIPQHLEHRPGTLADFHSDAQRHRCVGVELMAESRHLLFNPMMSMEHHHDPATFLAAAEPLVRDDIAHLAFLRAWVESTAGAAATQRRFMATWKRGDVAGVAFQRGDGPVVLGASAPEAAAAFAEALQDDYPQLDDVVGALPACEAFLRKWHAPPGKVFRQRHRLRDHVLRTLMMPVAARGCVRPAVASDLAWLIEMQHAFAAEVGIPISASTLAEQVERRLGTGGYRIWNDAEDVAYAGFGMAGDDASRVAPVYTRPAFRTRGYASSLVAQICAELVNAGRQVFLVTDVANPTSNSLYARLGFVALGDSYAFGLVDER